MTLDRNNPEIREYQPGEVIFRQGDRGTTFFVLQSGVVELHRSSKGRTYLIKSLDSGAFFGELSLILDRPRSATAVAKKPARLMVITAETFADLLTELPEFAARIIKELAHRLALANKHTDTLLDAPALQQVVSALCGLVETWLHHGIDCRGAVHIPITLQGLAQCAGLATADTVVAIEELAGAGLLTSASAAGIDGRGYVVSEPELLIDYMERRHRCEAGSPRWPSIVPGQEGPQSGEREPGRRSAPRPGLPGPAVHRGLAVTSALTDTRGQ